MVLNTQDYNRIRLQVFNMKVQAVIGKCAEAGDTPEEIKEKLIEFLKNMDLENIGDNK